MVFSVIVPIYKVEKYLKNCIESVLNQTFGDFELILVDDGSPDSCPAICDEYAQKDSRVKVIHKENGGLASARQAGIKIAEGDYVYSLDSDDSIVRDTLFCVNEIIEKTGAEIISFGYRWVKDSHTVSITSDCIDEGFYDRNGIEKHIYPSLLMDSHMNHISYYLAGKAIKRELLTPNQLAVNPKISLGEDLCCVLPCYMQAKSVYISKEIKYLYTVRTDSISKDFNADQIYFVDSIIREISRAEDKKPQDFEKQTDRYSAFMCLAILAAAANGNHFASAGEIKKNILNSSHHGRICKAQFDTITPKSRITVSLMKRKHYKTAFCFLNICENIKKILKKG